LVWHETFSDYILAFDWETRIKKWSVKKKETLIQGDFELIKIYLRKIFLKGRNNCRSSNICLPPANVYREVIAKKNS
jgi:hypothetical protein